jgi:release factor glutamine methyltransferase
MTVGEALAESRIDSSEARLLLAASSGLSRVALAAHPEAELAEKVVAHYRRLIERRTAGEPIAYLVGEREFYGERVSVTPEVLIPRPETELLVDFALEVLRPGGSILDLGTGSGAISLALKRQRPDAQVTAIDRSAGALGVARANAERLGLDVEFLHGSWFAPVAGRRFDVVLSNPPYVAEGDLHLSQGDVRFEPREALIGGVDGLEALRQIAREVSRHLAPGGWTAVEHGWDQAGTVRGLFSSSALASVSSRNDLAGIARITVGKYNLE